VAAVAGTAPATATCTFPHDSPLALRSDQGSSSATAWNGELLGGRLGFDSRVACVRLAEPALPASALTGCPLHVSSRFGVVWLLC
jgi:hypothetical protein